MVCNSFFGNFDKCKTIVCCKYLLDVYMPVGVKFIKNQIIMKHFLIIFLALFFFSSYGQVDVRGYYRSNGTYVQPHQRTRPNSIITDNYSYPGNYNPNKNSITTTLNYSSTNSSSTNDNQNSGINSKTTYKIENPILTNDFIQNKFIEIKNLTNYGNKTESGLIYRKLEVNKIKKPYKGQKIYVKYSGYLSNGELFDSNVEKISKDFGKFDKKRFDSNGYKPFPIEYGKKTVMIKGFLEAVELMNFKEKLIVYIPSNLAYSDKGAGTVIPPNSDLVFEIELLESPDEKTDSEKDEVLEFIKYHGGYSVPVLNEYILEKDVYKLIKTETEGNFMYYDGNKIYFKRRNNPYWKVIGLTFKMFNPYLNTYSYNTPYGSVYIDKDFLLLIIIEDLQDGSTKKYEYLIGDFDENIIPKDN